MEKNVHINEIVKFNIWSVITGVKRFVCLMYNSTDFNICSICSSDKLSSPNSKVSISKLSRNCRLFVNCSRASTYKQHSRKKWIASSITHPHTQPGSLIKFTLKRSAFKLLDLCLSLVCIGHLTLYNHMISI